MNLSASLLVITLVVTDAKAAESPATPNAAKLIFTFKTDGRESARSLHFSPDGSRLACAGWDGSVRVWDVSTGKEQFEWPRSFFGWTRVKFSPDGKSLAVGGFEGQLMICDAANGKRLTELPGHRE